MKNLIIILSLILACSPTPPPEDQVDPNPPITQTCANTCDHLRELKCPEAEDVPPPAWNPSEEPTSCERFCTNTQDKFDFLCWGKVKTCEEINECP